MSATLDLARQLIALRSVTPDDAGCQELMTARLEAIGFRTERLPFGEVSNFWAQRGEGEPLFVFAGHTDVVPSGPLDAWDSDPFSPVVRDGRLYGRGAADMKGSLAAMITACERFIAAHPDHRGAIAFLVTSDEEGPSVDGTRRVVEELERRGVRIDCCLVGEPTAERQVGDVIKNGRRGSLGGILTVRGIQGHIAYPHLADNPIHRLAPALAELCALRFDQGNEFFPPTSFQVSNINAGTGADNVIPGSVRVMFNFRYSTETNAATLRETVESVLRAHDLNFELEWRHSGEPFLTVPGVLVDAMRGAVLEVTGRESSLSTSGGTSDGRFIAKTGAQVVELGPVNATIHKINECVDVAELEALSAIYESVLRRLLAG
ncbi:MAG: succinyl-diaminopimelate desuccinylase [Gammaproteobacteria bacterium]|jgi:succinyl-diaminopimelate desuccinylase|nr:succinyl-diaminopimelate desuccinylase [Gammaproteobacteria bacterium]